MTTWPMALLLAALLLAVALLVAPGTSLADDPSPFGTATVASDQPAAGGLLQPIRHQIFAWQRDVNRALNARLVAIKRGEDAGALWAGIMFAFLYGVFHALGPGHGKSVVIGYFLGRAARPARGVAMAAWIALSHVVGAVVIVGLAHFFLSRALVSPTNEYLWLRLVSYGAILAIGLYMLWDWWRAGRGRHAHHHHHGHDHAHAHAHAHGHSCAAGDLAWAEQGRPMEQRALALVAGFVPCSGAILILLFAMANSLILAGIAMAAAIAFGMGMTLAMMGVCSILLRRQVSLRLPAGGGWSRGLALLGPLFVILVGATLLLLSLIAPGPV
jgi:nickel/cobalt exporter